MSITNNSKCEYCCLYGIVKISCLYKPYLSIFQEK